MSLLPRASLWSVQEEACANYGCRSRAGQLVQPRPILDTWTTSYHHQIRTTWPFPQSISDTHQARPVPIITTTPEWW